MSFLSSFKSCFLFPSNPVEMLNYINYLGDHNWECLLAWETSISVTDSLYPRCSWGQIVSPLVVDSLRAFGLPALTWKEWSCYLFSTASKPWSTWYLTHLSISSRRSFSTINELFDVPAPFLHYGVSPSVSMCGFSSISTRLFSQTTNVSTQ